MQETQRQRITIAIAAMGGQGGGVLADWIVELAEQAGFYAQATSVPGVAQRTGATIYYLELHPDTGTAESPVLALMPVSGDVDIVIAAELVEAGRAVQRGIVTPDRTTLIASTHRYYALAEKSAMADGRKSSSEIREALAQAAQRLVCFDMQALADTHDTVISATLFGALAGSGVLPFTRAQFEAAITASGKSSDNNLAAFDAAYGLADATAAATTGDGEVPAPGPAAAAASNDAGAPAVATLLERVNTDIAEAARTTALHGVRRLVDYQDPRYAADYLERVLSMQAHDPERDTTARLTDCVARHLALWMSYEDTIRVADVKIRRGRIDRCRAEVRAGPEEIVYLTEFMHPRLEEVADTLPRRLGAWLLATPWAGRALTKLFLRERKVHTSKIGGFVLLYGIAGLRRFRRATLRYAVEQERIEQWLARIHALATEDYALALEVALCQNLIKGYGDTHARGLENFKLVLAALDERPVDANSAALVRTLRDAALADENGTKLREYLLGLPAAAAAH